MSEAALTLNARQQRFAEAYASGCSATEAVRRAGYVQTDAAAGTHGYRLLKNARVIALIRRQRAELAERLRIDRDRVLRGLLVAYETARRNQDPMSMIAAMREAALLCGYYPTAEYRRDKLRPNGRLRKSVQELSSEDLLEMSDAELLDLADGDLEDEPVAEHDG